MGRLMTRRVFQNLALVLTPFAYVLGFGGLALRYFQGPKPGRRKPRLDAGPVEAYAGGAVKGFDFNGRWIYVLEEGGEIRAMDAQCTHLNCNVNWSARETCFVCPCHGGRFHRDGTVLRKPPPQPLRRQKLVVARGRVVLLDEEVG